MPALLAETLDLLLLPASIQQHQQNTVKV